MTTEEDQIRTAKLNQNCFGVQGLGGMGDLLPVESRFGRDGGEI